MPCNDRLKRSSETIASDVPNNANSATGPAERLLEAAFDVFSERGFAGTSTREICRRAGVNGAALNYHWGSKDRLWLAVAERCARSFGGVLERALSSPSDPADFIERVIRSMFDLLAADPRPIRFVIWATMQAEVVDYEATVQVFDPIVTRSIDTLLALQRAGLVGADVDVEVAAPLLHGQIVYAFADRAGHRRFYGKDLCDPDHAARFCAEIVRATRLVLGLGISVKP